MMPPRRAAALILSGIALTDLTFRISQVAVPLVVLAHTGSAAITGLSWGTTAVPVVLSPWWARRLRRRIRTGPAIAACYLGEAAALALIPMTAAVGALSAPVLLAAGLTLGVFETLDGPARDALIADLGDRLGTDRAFTLLSARDFFRRGSMVVGPAVGGALVAWGDPVRLLWVEVAAIVVSAALTCRVTAAPDITAPEGAAADQEPAERIWTAVRRQRLVPLGWLVRGTGCTLWFAFSLGLALLGVDTGRPGVLVATGLAAYGVGSLVGTPLAVVLLRRLPVLPAICAAWTLTGLAWLAMGATASVSVIAVVAALSGLAVVIGNGGVTALITRSTAGGERRTLLAGQSVLVNGSSATGLLVGGPVLALLGPRTTLEVAGTVLAAVAVGTWVTSRSQPTTAGASPIARRPRAKPSNRAATVACASGVSGKRTRTASPASVRESQTCRSSASVGAEM